MGTDWSKLRLSTAILLMAGMVLVACGNDVAPDIEADDPPEAIDDLEGVVHLNQSGGALEEVWIETWWDPFTEETGVEVVPNSPADVSRLRAQVESGNVEWDMAEIETGGQYLESIEQGLLTELDYDRFRFYFEGFGGNWDDLIEDALGTHGIQHAPYATILMFDKREFPDGGPQPSSLADLWNVEEFPGPRCIQESAVFNLEIGLAADGVDPEEMYPLDVDRAIDKFDELAPHIATFWRAGAEPIQLVADGECVMSTVWNGRPFSALTVDGIEYFGVAWDKGIGASAYWVLPAGAPNTEAAYALLAYYNLPEVGADNANTLGYGNVNSAMDDLLTDEARPYVATYEPNREGLTPQDDTWWVEHGPDAEEQFSEWRLGN
jgi:putative spermidine/putrescine transport system substrate-binding protein